MLGVGRDDHPAPGDLRAHQLRSESLPPGDECHLVGDDPLTGHFNLRHDASTPPRTGTLPLLEPTGCHLHPRHEGPNRVHPV